MNLFRYSTLSDAYKCLHYYELKHLLGQDDGSDRSGDMAFGTAIHTGVQDLFEIGNGVDAFTDAWAAREDDELEYSRYQWADLMRMGATLVEVFRDEHLKHFQAAHLEKQLEAPLSENIGLRGTVDFLGTYRGTPSVVDWKTSAMPYDAYKIRCNEQMYGYAYMSRVALGFKAVQVVYGVAIKDAKNPRWQFRTTALSDAILREKMNNVEQVCNRLAAGGPFYKNPGACVVGKRVCPFFEKCHGGQGSGGEEKT